MKKLCSAVNCLIREYTALKTSGVADKTRILLRSEPYGIPPVIVRPGLDSQQKIRVQEILQHAAEDTEGREILRGMMIEQGKHP